jgi:hypothetical protein
MNTQRHDHLTPLVALYAAGSETAGAPLPSLPHAPAVSTIDVFYRVRNTADGRFAVQAPDGLTIVQFFAADEMDAADRYAAVLNEPIWLALKPKGLRGYEPPEPDPGDVLIAALEKAWGYEDGPALPPVQRRARVFDGERV